MYVQACTESPTLFPYRWLFLSRFRYGALPGSFPFPSPPSLRLRSALSTMVDHGHTTVIKAEMERFMHFSSDVSARRKTSSSGPVTPSCAGQADVCLVRQSIKRVVRDSIGRQRGKLESLGGKAPPLQQAGARGIAGGAGRAPQGEELQATRVGTGLSLDALSVSVFARMHYLVKQL